MTRQPGWEARLHALVERARHQPYRLGVHDCAVFAANVIEAVTGNAAAAAILAGAYRSKAAALRFQRRFGRTLAEAVSNSLELDPQPVRQARRGDVLLFVDAAGVEHLGACVDHRGVTLHPSGLNFRPLRDFASAWRIG